MCARMYLIYTSALTLNEQNMDFGSALGAGISGGFGLIGSGLNYYFNKKLAEQQNQYNIDMWKMQNEYNSPQAQMQRFKDAGLNPNLIYGQGSAGNSSSAPQMVTPQAPQLDEHMSRLGQLFNIEGLRKLRAERREAEANASNTETNARRNREHFEFERYMGLNYTYDPVSGRYVPLNNSDQVEVIAYPAARFYRNDLLRGDVRNYRSWFWNIKSGEDLHKLRVPQINMLNYQSKYYPASYWINTGSNAVHGITDLINVFQPKNWLLPYKPGSFYKAPWSGNIY